MKKFTVFTLLLVVSLMLNSICMAQKAPMPNPTSQSKAQVSALIIATGGEKGNYFRMGNDIKTYCINLPLDIQTSEGSIANLTGIMEKKYDAGMVQEDVLQYIGKRDPQNVNRNQIKVIAALHSEVAHLVIPKDYNPNKKEKPWYQLWGGDEAPQAVSLESLKNIKIGSWGGSLVSARALSYFLNLNWDIIELNGKERENPQMPILLIGGQPYKPVEELLNTGNYTLIAIDAAKLKETAPFYLKEELHYKVGGQIRNIPTFGIRALLVGKAFRNEDRNTPMKELGKCILSNLADMADERNTSPLWNQVYQFNKTNDQPTDWSFFSN